MEERTKMKGVKAITITEEEATEEYEAFKEQLRREKTQYNRDMLALYAHMRKGGKVIDFNAVLKKIGLNEKQQPRLAICRADQITVRFDKRNNGSGAFYGSEYGAFGRKDTVYVPDGTFTNFEKNENAFSFKNQTLQTKVPLIPARIRNALRSKHLQNYYILWDVKDWEVVPKDPMILKRVRNLNLFIVLATWDMTKLERALVNGR